MNKLKRAIFLVREEGWRRMLGRGLRYLSNGFLRVKPEVPSMMVSAREIMALDWTEPRATWGASRDTGPYEIAWIMSPPGRGSGGHQNLFRFIRFAEDAGHRCRIYLYTTLVEKPTLEQTREMLLESDAYARVNAEIAWYDPKAGVSPSTDAIFATGWETAYPAYLDPTTAKRLYFVQDYEPSFYPVGTQSLLAENTYRFGFHGITAGKWLSHKLSSEYGMTCSHFDFASDSRDYFVTNPENRDELFFYARPVTARRAFELGVLVLEEFARRRPDVTINLAGWDVSEYDLPFAFRSHGAMDLRDLNELYNRCRAGLVLSLTNMSLLPLELIASGVTPVVNDAENNRLVSEHPSIAFVPPNPKAMAKKLLEIFEAPYDPVRTSTQEKSLSWTESGAQFVTALEGALRND